MTDRPFHPIANRYRLLPDDEMQELADDIKAQGLLQPIVMYCGKVIDGRNRWIACEMAGVERRVIQYAGDASEEALEAFVKSANENRRHDDAEERSRQRAERIERVAARRQEGASTRTIAEEEGVSQSQVMEDIKTATEQGCSVEPTNGVVNSRDGAKRPATKPEREPGDESEHAPRCPRCDRCGVVRGCPMCKELRAKDKPKPEPKPAPPPKESPVDAFGVEIPKRCRDAFCDPWIQETVDLLTELAARFRQARVADGMNKRKKHYPFFTPQDFIDGCGMIDNTIDQLVQHLEDRRPAGVCPSCKGKGCADCNMSGLVYAELHATLAEKAGAAQ